MNLVYITEKDGSAIKSQVYELINELALNYKIKKIYLLLATKDINEKIDFLFHEKIEIIIFKNFGMYPIIDFFNVNEMKKILNKISINQDTIFHVRSEYISYLFYKAYKQIYKYLEPKLYIDIRGSVKEELEMSSLTNLKKFIKISYFDKINNFILNKNFKCNVVSLKLEEYISSKYKIDNISIIPCIAGKGFFYDENTRLKTRKELNLLANDILLIFSSGASNNWQNNDSVVNLFSQKYKLLMLTNKKYTEKNVISKFVNFNDVPKYLNAADIGIILRDNHIINNVASPIKFSEYVSCGLPVITDGNVNQINDFINNYQCGNIISNFEQIEEHINNLLGINRTIISKQGIESYGIKNNALKYLNEYIILKGEK
jgi:hypothetical protein